MTPTLDRRRTTELGRYDVLGRPPRGDLTAMAEIAAQVAGTSMASISLIDDVEQHQVATAGFPGIVCAREDAMCNVVLDAVDPVVVEDALLDPRFRDNPFVTGVYDTVRFYAGHPLRTPRGTVIGMLCVLDTEPRTLDAGQLRALALLADRVVDLLELELSTRRLQRRTGDLSSAVDQLRGTQVELQRSNDQLAAFAGQVSHDLRNPLSTISASLGLLDLQLDDPRVDREMLRSIAARAARATRRMQATVDDLLAFAVVDGHLHLTRTDLADVVREVREDLTVELAEVDLEVGPLPVVPGDAVQLRSVMQNLLTNAAKFGHPGRPLRVAVTAERRGAAWRVSVRDNGLGISQDARERVFEPFTRTHTHVPGNGLGLATVRRIVSSHGGRLGVEDAPGGGAVVWFEVLADRS